MPVTARCAPIRSARRESCRRFRSTPPRRRGRDRRTHRRRHRCGACALHPAPRRGRRDSRRTRADPLRAQIAIRIAPGARVRGRRRSSNAPVGHRETDEPLREHVERRFGNHHVFDHAVGDAALRRGRLDDVVAILRDDDARGDRAGTMPRPPDALQRRGHSARAAEQQHAIDVADVDAEFERGGTDDRAQRAGAQRRFHPMAHVAFERAMMHADLADRAPRYSSALRSRRSRRPVRPRFPSRARCVRLDCARW